jgi:hypothetical protein
LATYDISDPIIWSTVVQTIVLTLTLVIFIMSFRTQNKATREAAYQKVLDDYSDSMKMLVERPELSSIQIELSKITRAANLSNRTPEQLLVRNYVLLLYGIFERLYMLYLRRWIDRETWIQWERFLTTIAKHPLFEEVHHMSEGMFDKPFQDFVAEIIKHKH